MKTIVSLTDEQITRLDSIAKRLRISRAEAIRQAIDRQYGESAESGMSEFEAALDDTFGLWADRGVDALAYVNALRDEWSR